MKKILIILVTVIVMGGGAFFWYNSTREKIKQPSFWSKDWAAWTAYCGSKNATARNFADSCAGICSYERKGGETQVCSEATRVGCWCGEGKCWDSEKEECEKI